MTEGKRGGAGRGQGRKPIAKDGELMRARPVRMTDEEWADAKFVGMQSIRDFVTRQAKRLRKDVEHD